MDIDKTMEAVAKGNIEALKSIYEQFRVIAYSVAFSILGNQAEAEDVLQETFLRVYEKVDTYMPGTNPKAWILSIARNLAYDLLRRRKKTADEEPPDLPDHSFAASSQHVQLKLELTEALLQLDEVERQIIVLYLTAGLKHSEISKQLGIPAGTVRWKYRQGLKRLANILGSESDDGKSLDI